MDTNLTWFRDHLTNDLLPNWHRAAVSADGLFHTNLARDWGRSDMQTTTLVGQCRPIHNFAIGYQVTGLNKYRDAARNGAEWLLDHFTDSEHGGFFWSIRPDGTVEDNSKNAYAHAFVLLALCHAFHATGDTAFLDAARRVRELLVTRFRDDYGGMRWRMTCDWTDTDERRSQNPMMHTFEALLALAETSVPDAAEARRSPGTPSRAPVDALEIAGFLFEEKQSVIPEFYDLDWRPLPSGSGIASQFRGRNSAGVPLQRWTLSIGHHFEWAFLLSRGVELGLPESLLVPARALLDTALAIGCGERAGSVQSYSDEKGRIVSDSLSWWEHAEALRALMHWALVRNEPQYLAPFSSILGFVKKRFLDPDHGGWFKSLELGGLPRDTSKGTGWKLDYHQVALCREAIQLGTPPSNGLPRPFSTR